MRRRKLRRKRNGENIRELTPEDSKIYCKISDDESIWTYTCFFGAKDLERAKKIITSNSNQYCKIYGLFNKAKRLIAIYTVDSIPNKKEASVCYMVGSKFRGKGYARLGIELLEEELGEIYEAFDFNIHKDNQASIRVQEKLGSTLYSETSKYFNFKHVFS